MSYENYFYELNSGQIYVAGRFYAPDALWQALSPFATNARLARIKEVASYRNCHFIPVLSDIYDRGNISAVLRSAEGMGMSEVHLVERNDRFRVANRVTRGAEQWMDIFSWNDPSVLMKLKARGYQVLSTGFKNAIPITEIDFSKPLALVFGNEKDGVSSDIEKLCEGCVFIPMQGFSQSFNISVAAAICMYLARQNFPQNDPVKIKFYESRLLLKSLTNPEKLLGALNVPSVYT